jgi:hypothetical protein
VRARLKRPQERAREKRIDLPKAAQGHENERVGEGAVTRRQR